MIGGLAANHRAEEPITTANVDLVVALDAITKTVKALEAVGFVSERFEWSGNLKGHSKVSAQISTEEFYREFPGRSIPADIHGISGSRLCKAALLHMRRTGRVPATAA